MYGIRRVHEDCRCAGGIQRGNDLLTDYRAFSNAGDDDPAFWIQNRLHTLHKIIRQILFEGLYSIRLLLQHLGGVVDYVVPVFQIHDSLFWIFRLFSKYGTAKSLILPSCHRSVSKIGFEFLRWEVFHLLILEPQK